MERTEDRKRIIICFALVSILGIGTIGIAEAEKEVKPVAMSQQVEVKQEEKETGSMAEIREEEIVTEELTEEELQEELYCDSLEELAMLVEAEAGNQSLEGKRYVAAVVLNRVEHQEFPNTIKEVIEQPPGQFSTYWNGSMQRATPSEETYEAIRLELQERINTEVLFFTAGGYGRYGKPWKKIGDHYFCTWRD